MLGPVGGKRRKSRLDGLHLPVLIGLVAALYFGVAKIGLGFAVGDDIVSSVWPPSGVALAAVVMLGHRIWPGIAVGAFAANLSGDGGFAIATGIAVGNVTSALLAGLMLERVDFRPNLRRVRDVVALSLLGAGVSTALNAVIGVGTLWIGGVVTVDGLWEFWRVWWLGDLTGVLLFAPPLLLALSPSSKLLPAARIAEASVLLALLAAVTILVIRANVTLAYPIFPLLVFAAMRYRQAGAVLAALTVSILGVYFTADGRGPFTGGSAEIELLRSQLFVAIAAITALMVAAMRTEWEKAEGNLVKLGESENALAEAQELVHIGSWEWEMASDTIQLSEELHRIFGFEPGTFTATYDRYLALIHDEDQLWVDRAIRRAVREGTSFQIEHRLLRPDGVERVLDCRGRVLNDTVDGPIRLLGTAQDVTDQRAAEERLAYLALHDPLTGLANRTLFMERLEDALGPERHRNANLAVLFCDIDDFKNVNDSLGHEAGDELLVALPPRLREALRPGDTVARFGGDEFVILCESLAAETDAVRIAERIGRAFARPLHAGDRTHHLSVSVGVVFTQPGAATAGEILRDADAAMYMAKAAGRGRFSLFDEEMRVSLIQRLETEYDLRRAVPENQLELRYQPVYSIASGRPIGVEALLRWRHPERGLLLPEEFIGIAEQGGLIGELGAWVIEEACACAAAWVADENQPDLRVSINLSAQQASDPGLAALVENSLNRSGLEPTILAIEITESALLEQGPLPIENMERLQDLGVHLILDDFGTGYSSLSYLKRIPFDVLKIDRDFIAGIGSRGEDNAIVEAILSMAASLGIAVVAEGVETEEQMQWLRERECRFAQGYLLTEPLTLADLTERMTLRR